MSTENLKVRKATGELQPFEIEKLETSLRRAHASKNTIQEVTHHILQEIEDGISTQDIYHHAFELLHKFEKRVALQYSMRRAITDLGPSGFPFEKFISEVLKNRGYETMTDQMVKGYCTDHEIDVVAWKPDSLIMVEAKYHGQSELKSDLKVVLYVKARFEDLSKMTYTYGKEPQTLTESWLVTNTKFTISAIKYAECQGLKVIGWNYPLDGNLHDLIDEAGLHPLTCLHSLSDHDKKILLDKGYILCSTIQQKPEILEEIGLSSLNAEAVLEEVQLISQEDTLKKE